MLRRLIIFLLLSGFACAGAFAAPQQSGQPNYIDPVAGMEFVSVPGGCFKMGSANNEAGRFSDEGPQREICVDGFMISRYEVTNAQYRLLNPAHDSGSHEGKSLDGDTQPVVFVSWKEASDYAAWLSRKTGRKVRLPNEAEWEFAARAGTDKSRFWGDADKTSCRYANVGDQTAKENWQNWAQWPVFDCSDGYTVSAPVGSFKANPLGLHDMLGNVWEWTADWYAQSYAGLTASRGRVTVGRPTDKSLRGGSWYSGPKNARNARRSWDRPDSRCNSLGFRLVMDLK